MVKNRPLETWFLLWYPELSYLVFPCIFYVRPIICFKLALTQYQVSLALLLFKHIFVRSDPLRAHCNEASYSETWVSGMSWGSRGVLLCLGLAGQKKRLKNEWHELHTIVCIASQFSLIRLGSLCCLPFYTLSVLWSQILSSTLGQTSRLSRRFSVFCFFGVFVQTNPAVIGCVSTKFSNHLWSFLPEPLPFSLYRYPMVYFGKKEELFKQCCS